MRINVEFRLGIRIRIQMEENFPQMQRFITKRAHETKTILMSIRNL